MLFKKNIKSILVGTAVTTIGVFSQPVFAEQVDLLLLYDGFTENRYNGSPIAAMTAWVDNANAAYADSQVDIQLNLVGLELFNPTSTGIADKLTEIRTSAEVASLRNQYGADFVSLIASRDGGICGIGNLAVNARYAFNVTGVQCGYITLVHELGHNMGLGHSKQQGSSGARYGYGTGYGVDNEFATIMAYPQAFNTYTRINRFSDPERVCEGLKCGVAIGDSEEADAHTALNNVRFDIANFRDSVSGTVDATDPVVTPVEVPAPSNLIASVKEQSITIVWRDNSTGENYFEIQRSLSENSGFSEIATASTGSTSFTDSDLEEDKTYYYRVRANLADVDSDWSNVSNATTEGSVAIVVSAPSNLQVTASSSDAINVTWTDNSAAEDFFVIQRSTDVEDEFVQVGTVARGNTSFIDQNVSVNTYFYRVQASQEGTLSDWSETASVTITGSSEPVVPPVDATGLNLLELGFGIYTSQTGSDARGYITQDGGSIVLMNNLWAASSKTFNITESTVLSFDYSSDVSGEIHGIGLEENNQPSSNRIFKLGGTQNWGIKDFQYNAEGDVQHFDIPIGQYFTGSSMRLVVVNDNDRGTGNSGYFSNISLFDDAQDLQADEGINIAFGLEYIDDETAIIFHRAGNQANVDNTLCVNGDCDTGTWNNGRLERQVDVNVGEDYLIEFRLQEDDNTCSTSSIVTFSTELSGQATSPCFK